MLLHSYRTFAGMRDLHAAGCAVATRICPGWYRYYTDDIAA